MKAILFVLGILLIGTAGASETNADADITHEKIALIAALENIASDLPNNRQPSALDAISALSEGKIQFDYSYGWERARPFIEHGGIEALVDDARHPDSELRYAKLDALFAAGVVFFQSEPAYARDLNAALLELAQTADDFERPMYAHASAELATLRCDVIVLEQSLDLVIDRDSLRYQFWSARLSGDGLSIIEQIKSQAEGSTERHLHSAIDGYRLIGRYGYCPREEPPIAD